MCSTSRSSTAAGTVIVEEPELGGQSLTPADDLGALVAAGPIAQAQAIFTPALRTFEHRKALLRGGTEFGSIRIDRISTGLLKGNSTAQMRTPLITTAVAILVTWSSAMLMAQIALRPIHVISSGLARLGRGEMDVKVDLPGAADWRPGRLVQGRDRATRRRPHGLAGRARRSNLSSRARRRRRLVRPNGTLLFANPAMRPALATGTRQRSVAGGGHPYRGRNTRSNGASRSAPATVQVPDAGERLLLTHPVDVPRHIWA